MGKIKFQIEAIKTYRNFPLALECYFNRKRGGIGTLSLRNGLKFIFRPNEMNDFEVIHDIFSSGCYETGIKDAKVIIDIGSHIGSYSIYASNLYKDARIYAYEPCQENYALLLLNRKINNARNIKAFNLGISPKRGKERLFMGDNTGRHSMVNKTKDYEEMNCITLKDVFELNNIKDCSILKMDIEGAEYDILFNAPHWLFNKTGTIIMEWHRHNKYGKNDLKIFLARKGFEIVKEKDGIDAGILIFEKGK